MLKEEHIVAGWWAATAVGLAVLPVVEIGAGIALAKTRIELY